MIGLRILLNRIINVIGLVLGVFLALRIIFRFFAANPGAPFVSWIYSVSNVLVYPFRGIFGDLRVGTTGGVLDISAFISLLAYGIVLSLLVALVNALFNPVPLSVRDRHVRI